MTLLIVLILAAVLVVISIFLIKKTAREKLSGKPTNFTSVKASGPTAPTVNPGSIPDKTGTKGDGDSYLSSGKQG